MSYLPDEGGVLHSARSVTHHQGDVVSNSGTSGRSELVKELSCANQDPGSVFCQGECRSR